MVVKMNDKKRLVKIKSANVESDTLALRVTFGSRAIEIHSVLSVRLERVFSLVDELGLYLEADRIYFLTDAMDGFMDIAKRLDFDQKFGAEWYARAEAGECFTWVKET